MDNNEFDENYEDEGFVDDTFDEDEINDDEEFEGESELSNNPNQMHRGLYWGIIITVALVVGVTVYFVTDALINGGNKKNVVLDEDTPMTLNDEMVKYLYGNISFDVRGMRNTIFFENDKVEVDDFDNNDKFFFAFRYITSQDFTPIYEEVYADGTPVEEEPTDTIDATQKEDKKDKDDKNKDKDKKEEKETYSVVKEYSILNETIATAMEDFFGEGISYSTEVEIPIGVNFTVNGKNAGNLRYDAKTDSFLIKFDSNSDLSVEKSPIKPYYGSVVSAIKLAKTNHIVLKEKVIFTKVTENKGEGEDANVTYDYSICADYNCNEILDTKTGVTKSQYYNAPIELDDYEDQATTITYTFFKDSVNEYHFLSSEKDK